MSVEPWIVAQGAALSDRFMQVLERLGTLAVEREEVTTAAHYLQAVRWRLALKAETLAAFGDIDVAITASSMDPACRIDDNDALARNYWRQARMPFNVTGQPAVVIPAGFSRGRLPLSLQIVGHPFGEAMCYRVAQAYESAMGWVEQHPSLE